jgi:predicted transcriptional regulator
MKRTTVSLSDDLAVALAREARRSNRSASDITREALEHHLGLASGERRTVPFAAVGRSGHRNTAREIEELLEREWDGDARDR